MGRLVELILFGFLLWLAYEGLKARIRAFFSPGPPARRPPSQGPSGESLVRCAECGTHFPQSRGVAAGGEVFCSERCRKARA
jgi:hypothetical protein